MPSYLDLIGGAIGIGSSLSAGRKAEKEAEKAQKENIARINKITGIYKRVGEMFKPTGTYGKIMFENLRKQKALDVGATAQQYLRSGIGGTSYADVNAQYERNTGRASRMSLEDYLAEKYAGVQAAKANFLSGIQSTGPSYSDIATAYSGVGTGISSILGALKPEPKPDISKQKPKTVWAGGNVPNTYGYLETNRMNT
jgi:hypothetical protein